MNGQDSIANTSRTVFEHSVANLDVATANRLRLMRRDCLSQTATSRFRAYLLPVSASLAIALGILIFLPQLQTKNTVTRQDTIYISTEDDADVELVDWLADAPVYVSTHSEGKL